MSTPVQVISGVLPSPDFQAMQVETLRSTFPQIKVLRIPPDSPLHICVLLPNIRGVYCMQKVNLGRWEHREVKLYNQELRESLCVDCLKKFDVIAAYALTDSE